MPNKKKIVVIDDEEGVTELLKKLFEREGYEVKTQNDALKGLELVRSEKPDCVLLDIKMPTMDGIEALNKIREFDEDVGIIIITGYGSLESAMETMKLGAYDYITKPFDLSLIKDLVTDCIRSKKHAT